MSWTDLAQNVIIAVVAIAVTLYTYRECAGSDSGGGGRPKEPSKDSPDKTIYSQAGRIIECYTCGGNHYQRDCPGPVACWHCEGAHDVKPHTGTP